MQANRLFFTDFIKRRVDFIEILLYINKQLIEVEFNAHNSLISIEMLWKKTAKYDKIVQSDIDIEWGF